MSEIESTQPAEQPVKSEGATPTQMPAAQSAPDPTIPPATVPAAVPAPAAPKPIQSYTPPTAMVDGQAFTASAPDPGGEFGVTNNKKPSKWRWVFIILGVLQLLGVGLFFLVMIWASMQAKAGVSGTEFIGLLLFITVVPAVAIVALLNLIGLPIYMLKQKPSGKALILCVISLVISVLLALYGAYVVYQLRVALPKHMTELSENSRKKAEQTQQQFAADNANPEISKDEAITLLKSCQIKGFYYTNQTSSKQDGNWAETSTTGVVLTKIGGQPYRISVADRLVPELVPIAREAKKSCGVPQFWHDGQYEQ